MEQLLAFLLEYGIFVGIVILTVVLIWATYAIYNAVVRAKTSKVIVTPAVTEPLKKMAETPIEKPEIKSPSLEGEGVVKTGPRKMLQDEDDAPIVSQNAQPVIAPKPIKPAETQPLASETSKVEADKPILEVKKEEEKAKEALTSQPIDIPKTQEKSVSFSNEYAVDKNTTLPLKSAQRRIILPKDDEEDDLIALKPKSNAKKATTIKKVEPTKPVIVPKEIIVQQPKPKKKLPPKFHVLYRASDDSWYVKVEGNDAIISILETQREAISYATIKALKSDSVVIVHRKDGKIRKQATMKDVTDSEEEE